MYIRYVWSGLEWEKRSTWFPILAVILGAEWRLVMRSDGGGGGGGDGRFLLLKPGLEFVIVLRTFILHNTNYQHLAPCLCLSRSKIPAKPNVSITSYHQLNQVTWPWLGNKRRMEWNEGVCEREIHSGRENWRASVIAQLFSSSLHFQQHSNHIIHVSSIIQFCTVHYLGLAYYWLFVVEIEAGMVAVIGPTTTTTSSTTKLGK